MRLLAFEDRRSLFIAMFAIFGILAPLLWIIAYRTFGDGWQSTVQTMMMGGAESVLITIWPTSVLMIADPRDETWQVPAMSAVANGFYYSLIGLLIWLGWRRNKLYWVLCLTLFIGLPLVINNFF